MTGDLPPFCKELTYLVTCSDLSKALHSALGMRGGNYSNLKQNHKILPVDRAKLLDQMGQCLKEEAA